MKVRLAVFGRSDALPRIVPYMHDGHAMRACAFDHTRNATQHNSIFSLMCQSSQAARAERQCSRARLAVGACAALSLCVWLYSACYVCARARMCIGSFSATIQLCLCPHARKRAARPLCEFLQRLEGRRRALATTRQLLDAGGGGGATALDRVYHVTLSHTRPSTACVCACATRPVTATHTLAMRIDTTAPPSPSTKFAHFLTSYEKPSTPLEEISMPLAREICFGLLLCTMREIACPLCKSARFRRVICTGCVRGKCCVENVMRTCTEDCF